MENCLHKTQLEKQKPNTVGYIDRNKKYYCYYVRLNLAAWHTEIFIINLASFKTVIRCITLLHYKRGERLLKPVKIQSQIHF